MPTGERAKATLLFELACGSVDKQGPRTDIDVNNHQTTSVWPDHIFIHNLRLTEKPSLLLNEKFALRTPSLVREQT